MGIKLDGGRVFDVTLAKVNEGEPIFVLRAQDRLAPMVVRLWAELAKVHGCQADKLEECQSLAHRMELWGQDHGTKWPD